MVEPQKISYTVEQDLNEYTGNIEIIEKKYNADTIPWSTIHDAQAVQQKMIEEMEKVYG